MLKIKKKKLYSVHNVKYTNVVIFFSFLALSKIKIIYFFPITMEILAVHLLFGITWAVQS